MFDGIDEQQCNAILPMKSSCNMIVTTTSHPVANRCTYDGGYIYSTSTLEKKDCDDLLKEILSSENSSDLEQISASIIKRCDGHPLSLVSVANFLQSATGNSRSKSCEKVCRLLGSYVEKQSAFHELREVLMRNYGNLSGPLIKTCLLYMSIFPKGFQIRRKSLIRRWVAEGYIQSEYGDSDETVAHENFENLLDQNIIEPMGACDNARVKTCRTHSVMREFMLHRSFCDHFIGSLDTMSELDDPSTFRHLFIQKCTNINILRLAKKKLRARSLTIFGSGGGAAVSCIAECELLQVLDLKECNDFDDNRVKGIMKDNLSRLKYLSLGSATTKLPKAIEKLHCLHTLELSKTNVVALPIEVIRLPHLVHLFGKVKLRKKRSIHAVQVIDDIISNKESIAEKSKLQTLSGFVIDKDSIIPQLMVHMKRLRKVKVWCDSTGEGTTDWMKLKKAIENFVKSEMDTAVGERSLSLYLGDGLERFPELGDNIKVELNGFVSSLKLQGKLNQLPNFDTSLNGITKLCLSSTNLEGHHYSDLGKLLCLKYLKLVENYLGGFVIKIGTFPSLEFLCLLMPSFLYAVPEIQEGALPKLVSLQLLCKHLHGLAGINIKNHTKLQEVALDSAVSMETINTWENEAQKHPKRPKVLFFKRVGTSKIKYTATERPKTPESTGAGDSMEIDK